MIKLGQKVRDKITGFAGIVTGRVEYITGCNQVLVAPPCNKNGALTESQWFDEQRVEVIDSKLVRLDNSKSNGPDRAAPNC